MLPTAPSTVPPIIPPYRRAADVPLSDRISRRIVPPRFPNGAINYDPCHLWEGAKSQSGYRAVWYPVVWYSGKVHRVNRLVLILEFGAGDVPPEAGEPFDSWFARALLWYKHREASHTCDNSLCVNFTHLEWKGHRENVQEQTERRRRQA